MTLMKDWTALNLISAPTTEPVSRTELKAHLRIDATDEDTYLDGLLLVARKRAENVTARAFVTQTWRTKYDCFPEAFVLPRPKLQSVTSIQYLDGAGTTQTLSADAYQVDADGEPGRIIPAYGQAWPSTRSGALNAATVTFVAGYGGNATDVPDELRHAIKLLAAHWYENREALGQVGSALPFAVDSLLGMHSMRGF